MFFDINILSENGSQMPDTEFIFFDLGNVITFFDREKAFRQMAEVSGAPEDRVRTVLMDDGLQREYETGTVDCRQFYDAFCEATGTRPEFEKLIHAGSDIFRLNVPMVPVLTQLRAIGFPIGILSNTCQAHWDYVCDRFTIVGHAISNSVLSFQAGSMKPDAGIFDKAIKIAGCDPACILFTDDIPENVEGAKAAGIDAVHFESVEGFRSELSSRGININM